MDNAPTLEAEQLIIKHRSVYQNARMNADEAMHRLTEALCRKRPALARERNYRAWPSQHCDYIKGIPFHLPSQQKPERFLTALVKNSVAPGLRNQALNAMSFLRVE